MAVLKREPLPDSAKYHYLLCLLVSRLQQHFFVDIGNCDRNRLQVTPAYPGITIGGLVHLGHRRARDQTDLVVQCSVGRLQPVAVSQLGNMT